MGVTTALIGGAVIGGGLSYLAASESADAASSAADSYAASAGSANALTWDMYQQTRKDYAPWREAGGKAINQLSTLTQPGGQLYDTNFTYSDLYADPSYEWVKQQGINSLAAKSAAAGNYGSGNLGTALVDYGTNLASTEYQNAYNRWMTSQNALYNRLAGVAGTGQAAAAGTASAGTSTANTMGSNLLSSGANTASANMSAANTWSNYLSNMGNMGGNLINQYAMYNMLGMV